MTVEFITCSISTKVWDRAGIELATPGSAVRLTSVARHITDYAARYQLKPGRWIHSGSPALFFLLFNNTLSSLILLFTVTQIMSPFYIQIKLKSR